MTHHHRDGNPGELATLRPPTGVRLDKDQSRRWRNASTKAALVAELLEQHPPGTLVRDHRSQTLGRLGGSVSHAPEDNQRVTHVVTSGDRAAVTHRPKSPAAPPPSPPKKAAPVLAPAPVETAPPEKRKVAAELIEAAQQGRALALAVAELAPSAATVGEAMALVATELLELRRLRAETSLGLAPDEIQKLRRFLTSLDADELEPQPLPEEAAAAAEMSDATEEPPPTERPEANGS